MPVWVSSISMVSLTLWAMASASTPMVCAARPKERHHPAFRPPLSLIIELRVSMLFRWQRLVVRNT